jgi:hypothetical protein
MLSKSKLVTAAAAAGAVCALAASGAAMASPKPIWSGPSIVHGSYTNATPGLSAYNRGTTVHGTFLVWKGQGSNAVYYRFRVAGRWSKVEAIPGAGTTAGPAAAFYYNYKHIPSEFVTWKALHSSTIWYATGEITGSGSKLSWSKTRSIAVKGDKYASSESGPAVIFPLNEPSNQVLISWRGPGQHVRYEIGAQNGRYFSFGKSEWISSNLSTLTSDTPALAEVIGAGGQGTVYVFWKAAGKGESISYATTPDRALGGLEVSKGSVSWSLQGAVPHNASSTSGPAASAIGGHGTGGLLLAYKGPGGDNIRYQLLTTAGWSGYHFVSGKQHYTSLSPSLLNRTLGDVSPTSSGVIYLRNYNG